MSNSNSNYLFLYLKTGGGHLAPARSIANFIENQTSKTIAPVLIDGFKEVKPFIGKLVEGGYRKSQIKAQWAFEWLYAFNKFLPLARFSSAIISAYVKPYLRKEIETKQPKKIVIFHFLLIKPVLDLLKQLKLEVPVITVVTDPYTVHPIWFLKKNSEFVVFSNRVKKYAVKKGISADNIHVFPFILNEKFTQIIPEKKLIAVKNQYEFLPDKKTILILGGGDGMPKGELILKNLLQSNIDAQIAIVCGRNKKLYEQSQELKKQFPDKKIMIYGFVDFIYELINISDIVITKCGASTFMEILISQKIPIINNYIWEQEKGNMEYVRDNQLGIYEKNIKKLPEVIGNLLTDEQYYAQIKQNIRNAGLKNGTVQVSDFIIEF